MTGKYCTIPLCERDVSSRFRRRKILAILCTALQDIRDAEYQYMERIPQNLESSEAYGNAESAVEQLDEVLELIRDVYQ